MVGMDSRGVVLDHASMFKPWCHQVGLGRAPWWDHFGLFSCFLHSQAKSTSGTCYLIKYAHVMLLLLETEAVDGILSMVFSGIITVNKIPQA